MIYISEQTEYQLITLAQAAGKPIDEFVEMLLENYQIGQLNVNDDNALSIDEQIQIQNVMAQIQQADYSEFEDWETVKTRL